MSAYKTPEKCLTGDGGGRGYRLGPRCHDATDHGLTTHDAKNIGVRRTTPRKIAIRRPAKILKFTSLKRLKIIKSSRMVGENFEIHLFQTSKNQ